MSGQTWRSRRTEIPCRVGSVDPPESAQSNVKLVTDDWKQTVPWVTKASLLRNFELVERLGMSQ